MEERTLAGGTVQRSNNNSGSNSKSNRASRSHCWITQQATTPLLLLRYLLLFSHVGCAIHCNERVLYVSFSSTAIRKGEQQTRQSH